MWTEAEARTKWCPLARQLVHHETSTGVALAAANRTPEAVSRCVASECMSWRWELTKEPLPNEPTKYGRLGLAYALQPTTYEHGYCGAFGQPSGRPPAEDAA
jgi:hypothetical protein